MAKLNSSDVSHVAKLANIPLSSEEIEIFEKQLSSIVSYMEELNEVDTSNINPTSQTTGLENVYREDKVNPQRVLSQTNALSGSQKTHNGYFVVPGILTQKDE